MERTVRVVSSNMTTRQITQLGGCSEAEAELFVEEALTYRFCDISVTGHGDVTLKSRRLKRDEKTRINARNRKRKQRERERAQDSSHTDVTGKSQHTPFPSPTPTPKGVISDSLERESQIPSPKKGPPPCPHQKIIELYHDLLPELPTAELTEVLKKTLRARWREDPKRQTLDWWSWYFTGVSKCDFLVGKKIDWSANFGWLIGPKNMTKVLNGQYVNRKGLAEANTLRKFMEE